jgi:hypothetical protein
VLAIDLHVMAGLGPGVVPAIQVCVGATKKDVDALLKAGHDESGFMKAGITSRRGRKNAGKGALNAGSRGALMIILARFGNKDEEAEEVSAWLTTRLARA